MTCTFYKFADFPASNKKLTQEEFDKWQGSRPEQNSDAAFGINLKIFIFIAVWYKASQFLTFECEKIQ
jgi:hypothetical protein